MRAALRCKGWGRYLKAIFLQGHLEHVQEAGKLRKHNGLGRVAAVLAGLAQPFQQRRHLERAAAGKCVPMRQPRLIGPADPRRGPLVPHLGGRAPLCANVDGRRRWLGRHVQVQQIPADMQHHSQARSPCQGLPDSRKGFRQGGRTFQRWGRRGRPGTWRPRDQPFAQSPAGIPGRRHAGTASAARAQSCLCRPTEEPRRKGRGTSDRIGGIRAKGAGWPRKKVLIPTRPRFRLRSTMGMYLGREGIRPRPPARCCQGRMRRCAPGSRARLATHTRCWARSGSRQTWRRAVQIEQSADKRLWS